MSITVTPEDIESFEAWMYSRRYSESYTQGCIYGIRRFAQNLGNKFPADEEAMIDWVNENREGYRSRTVFGRRGFVRRYYEFLGARKGVQ